MKERPILFSGPMVRAIYADLKTYTRRVIKPQADHYVGDVLGQQQIYACSGPDDFGDPDKPIRCPYGQPGDLLWVRETWAIDEGDQQVVFYRATDHETCGHPWKPSIHMPKKYARLWLRITNTRVERLYDITEKEAMAEGFKSREELLAWFEKRYGRIDLWLWVVGFERVKGAKT